RMNDRGHYGKNGVRVGQQPQHMIYVESARPSTGALILGAIAVGGAVLYARHQSKQIEQLFKTSGLPYQSFTGDLRETVRAIPIKASETYRGMPGRVRPSRAALPPSLPTELPPSVELPAVTSPAHSIRARSGRR